MESDDRQRLETDFDPPYRPDAGAAATLHPDSLANGSVNSFFGVVAPGTPRWNSTAGVGTPISITYAFRDVAPTSYPTSDNGDPTTTFAPLSTAARNEVRSLIAYVGSITGIRFTEVPDSPNATIEIGSFTFTSTFTGYAYYPNGSPTAPSGTGGDIWINRTEVSPVGPGTFFDQLFLHEFGHALGLKHPFVGTTAEQLITSFDRVEYTLMTYQNYGDLSQNLVPRWTGSNVATSWLYRSDYGLLDVEALTYLYGSSSTANTSDNTYRFDTTAVFQTIVDRGGHDTIDTSALNLPSVIDLTPGHLSSIGIRTQADWLNILAAQGMPSSARTTINNFLSQHTTELFTGLGDVSINADTTIEDAIGGSAGDSILGNDANNKLTGGGGNDAIDGGAGIDTAVYALAFSNYTVTRSGTNATVAAKTGLEGTDALASIERLRFSDGVVLLDQGSNGPAAFRLYQAAFARSPDEGGLKVQIHAMDTGTSLLQLARNFIGSGEFQAKYGSPDNAGYATALYKNVLGRDPDAGGLKVQVDALNGGLSREQMLVNFSESGENLALTQVKTVGGLFVTFVDSAFG
ncbi:DUF4214 domain-containing protein [Roseiterribacter gracilis]|uniref:Peptidase metallopeptidase domain-containing protein n=1 Tax=Roseiterribacter gracilis TaxID=2812848 RepID=A0A8S8XCS5_9PROT|nr:hypothetical protein TMPK1_17160 [Rhodospirillales bacterium TMPK1]